MDRQGTAIKWILILGIGTFLFLAGTATLMRQAGLGGGPVRVRPDASPYDGEAALRMWGRFKSVTGGPPLAEVFNGLMENGSNPRLIGGLERPEAVWTLTEGRVEAPVILVLVPATGENGLLTAAWLAELVRVVPRRGLRHRLAMLWMDPGQDNISVVEILDRLRTAGPWTGRIGCVLVVSVRRGQGTGIARDRETPGTLWDTLLDAARRSGYTGLLRPMPTVPPWSGRRTGGSVPLALLELGVPQNTPDDSLRNALKAAGDVFYHALVTLGYEMIVRTRLP